MGADDQSESSARTAWIVQRLQDGLYRAFFELTVCVQEEQDLGLCMPSAEIHLSRTPPGGGQHLAPSLAKDLHRAILTASIHEERLGLGRSGKMLEEAGELVCFVENGDDDR